LQPAIFAYDCQWASEESKISFKLKTVVFNKRILKYWVIIWKKIQVRGRRYHEKTCCHLIAVISARLIALWPQSDDNMCRTTKLFALLNQEVAKQDPMMNDAESRAEGGILPGLPSSLGGGGAGKEGGGTMFNQPMALMGGFTMLAMPAQDAMAMASSFQQFASNMPSLPGLPG
jgi:hypothetical protein